MKIIAIIVVFSLLIYVRAQSPPLQPETDLCRASNIPSEAIWNTIKYSSFEIYFTLTVGSIATILIIVSLMSWICFPSFLLPFDIIFIILCGTLLDILTLITTAIYSLINQQSLLPQGFDSFCKGVGFLNMLGNVVYLYYNAFFCGALAYTIHKTLKKPLLTMFRQHLTCLIISLIALVIIIFTSTDDPFTNMCLYRLADSSSLGLFFLHFILALFSLYALYKFKGSIPQNSFFQQQSHFRYYFIYMVIFFIFQVVNCILFLIGNISCSTEDNNSYSTIKSIFTVSNCIIIILAYASIALRLGHPFIFRKLKNMKEYHQISSQEHHQDAQEFSWVSSLVNSIKGSQVLSFIEAIMMNYIEHIRKYPSTLSTYHFQRHYSFTINQDITDDYVRRRITNRQSHFARQLSEGLTTLKYEVKIFTPQYYSWIFRKEKINLFSSFDIRKNLSILKEKSFSQRGKKGQFFFCTFDHKVLLKTIKSQEANVLLEKTESLYGYFQDHADSLIVKTLGLFKFQRQDIKNQTIHLIIMKNISGSSIKQIMRTYDIKGTLANRETLKQKRIKLTDETKLRDHTLKDMDFKILQQKLYISEANKEKILNVLTRDIEFLNDIALLDYSLLIIKRRGDATNQFGQFASTKQPNVYYHLGIIDYLESYGQKRKNEQVFKTLITNQEATLNSPQNYSERLIAFINDIL